MGRYLRVWIYEDNEDFIDSVDNVGKTVNNALSMYSSIQDKTPQVSQRSPTTLKATVGVASVYAPTGNMSFTCNNGHMLINGTGRCISKACKYGGKY